MQSSTKENWVNWVNGVKTRPRTPWHVGPLKVGLLAINNQQNPPDPWAHQTHGPTRPTGPPDQQGPQNIMLNYEKL